MADPGTFGDWDRWFAIVHPKSFGRLLDHNLRFAGSQIGNKAVAMLTDLFTADPDPPMVPNAPLTVAIKGDSNPLTDRQNRLVRSHAFDQPDPGTIRVGSKATSDGGRDITRALHYGFAFNLAMYPRMAMWLRAKLRQLEKEGRLPPGGPIRGPHGKPGFIVIPPRPWMGWLFESREFGAFVAERAGSALYYSLRGRILRSGRRTERRDW